LRRNRDGRQAPRGDIMTEAVEGGRHGWTRKYLDPGERISEVLFGLIMVLTYTLTAGMSVSDDDRGVHELLVATVGCNIAWGIIDGVFYVMGALFERGRQIRLARALQGTKDEAAAMAVVAGELDGPLEPITTPEGRRRLYREIVGVVSNTPTPRNRILKEDLYGALASFWLVFLSTIPAAVPFLIFTHEPRFALRVSNALLLALLFLVGYQWARFTGGRGLVTGAVMTLIGGALVGLAVALGG
jgi:hypothetical protein